MTKHVMTELKLNLTGRLTEIYGPEEGIRNSGVLVPAILRDFSGMIEKAAVGERVTETYRTEDGKAEIVLDTVKTTGESEITVIVKQIG
ncbi:MAG: hypothetical protein K6G16_02995 [Lachnospiraceae bacterium]|nr:hypothetical protein [Lachnospiraceae bacterium]